MSAMRPYLCRTSFIVDSRDRADLMCVTRYMQCRISVRRLAGLLSSAWSRT